jgi:MFS superfamily sulfate permease-like transporter
VYAWSGGFDADEFSAMPSVHVGWALIVAIAVITVSRSRWRWLAAAYPVLTLLVVVVTANHFWLDGIAAGLLVVLVMVMQRIARGLRSGKASEGPQVRPVRGDLSMRS